MGFNTLEKTIELLNLFLGDSAFLSANEIGKAIKMSRSNTHKYITTLRKHDFLEYHSDKGLYSLGFKFFQFSAALEKQFPIDKLAKPYLEKLHNEVQETVVLVGLRNFNAFCIESIGGENGLVYMIKKGSYMPLHCGATGRVILSHLEDEDIDRFLEKTVLKKYTQYTATDKEIILQQIQEVRKCGFADSHEELTEGACAMAVPIFDEKNKIIAALGILGLVKRTETKKSKDRKKKLLFSYAKKISDVMRGIKLSNEKAD